MTGKNAVGDDRKFWGVLPVMDAGTMTGIAQQAEAAGYEGLFAIQVYGPPFVPLAVAAAAALRVAAAPDCRIPPLAALASGVTEKKFTDSRLPVEISDISYSLTYRLRCPLTVYPWRCGVKGDRSFLCPRAACVRLRHR